MKIGIDSVEVKRIKKLFSRHNNLEKIYSKTELENIFNCAHSFLMASGYFAVKEAFLKALGIGIFNEISLNQIIIEYNVDGSPTIKKTPQILDILEKYNFSDVQISITHTKKISTAVCLLY